jgi:hypothetical protein
MPRFMATRKTEANTTAGMYANFVRAAKELRSSLQKAQSLVGSFNPDASDRALTLWRSQLLSEYDTIRSYLKIFENLSQDVIFEYADEIQAIEQIKPLPSSLKDTKRHYNHIKEALDYLKADMMGRLTNSDLKYNALASVIQDIKSLKNFDDMNTLKSSVTYLSKGFKNLGELISWLLVQVRDLEASVTFETKPFTWRGIKVEILGLVPENVVREILDAVAMGLEVLDRRGLESFVMASLKKLIIADDPYKFTFTMSKGETGEAAGWYTKEDKSITIVVSKLRGRNAERYLQKWWTEVFLHELGHHIHMSLLPATAKAFWDSGWEYVNAFKKELEVLESRLVITKDDIQGFIHILTKNLWDIKAAGSTLKGFDRAKFLYFLHTQGLSTVYTQARATGKAKHMQIIVDAITDLDPNTFAKFFTSMAALGYPLRLFAPELWKFKSDKPWNPTLIEALLKTPDMLSLFQDLYENQWLNLNDIQMPLDIATEIAAEHATVKKAIEDQKTALGIPTEYGKEDIQEDFAETFVFFVADPDRLSPIARWRMGRTLGISDALGKKVLKISHKVSDMLKIFQDIHAIFDKAFDVVTIEHHDNDTLILFADPKENDVNVRDIVNYAKGPMFLEIDRMLNRKYADTYESFEVRDAKHGFIEVRVYPRETNSRRTAALALNRLRQMLSRKFWSGGRPVATVKEGLEEMASDLLTVGKAIDIRRDHGGSHAWLRDEKGVKILRLYELDGGVASPYILEVKWQEVKYPTGPVTMLRCDLKVSEP